MRILYVHQYFTTPRSAGGTRSYEMAEALIKRGHDVVMLCGGNKINGLNKIGKSIYRGKIDGIDVIQIAIPYSNNDSIPRRFMCFVKFSLMSIRFAFREQYDLIFATSTPLTAGIPGFFAKILRHKKFVFEVRDLWPALPKALGMKNPILLLGMSVLEWMSYHCADACIGLSPGICEGIKRRSQKNKKVAMIPNGCDLNLFTPVLRGPLNIEGINHGEKVAIFTGAHGIANGLDAVLDAAIELKKMGRKDIVLAFFGDGNTKEHLLLRVKKENIDNCRFFNPIPKKDLTKILASADVGLMILANIPAFYYGTSPNKFFDYISSGLPVLNNYPGWLADMINENNLGVVVEPNNARAFAEGLAKLMDNQKFRDECGRNARAFAEKNFSRLMLCNNFTNFIESVK